MILDIAPAVFCFLVAHVWSEEGMILDFLPRLWRKVDNKIITKVLLMECPTCSAFWAGGVYAFIVDNNIFSIAVLSSFVAWALEKYFRKINWI